MAVVKTNPQLILENGEATALEIVAHTIDYVCEQLKDRLGKCRDCPFNSLCNSTSDGYSRADLLRRIAKECKSK